MLDNREKLKYLFCQMPINKNLFYFIKGNGVNEDISRNEQPLIRKKPNGESSNQSSNEVTNNSFLILNPHSVMRSEEKNNPSTTGDIENMNSSSGIRESLANAALPDVVIPQDTINVATDQVILYFSNIFRNTKSFQ